VTPEPIRAIFAALAPAVRLAGVGLLFVLFVLATGLLLIAQAIAPVILRLLTLIRALAMPELPPLEPPTFEQFAEQINQWMDRVPGARMLVNILAVVLLLGGIAFIFWLALDRLSRRRAAGEDETRESIASPGLIARQLLELWRRLRPGQGGPGRPFVRLDGPPLDPRLAVRRAYQAMLAWAADTLGEPRSPGQTPVAYETRIAGRAPAAAPDLAVLTAAYLKARYSAQAPTPGEAEAARRAAAQIRQIKIKPFS
jgi:hypothetical protein